MEEIRMTVPVRLFRVPAVGSGEEPQPAGDTMPPLAELQAWVGGYVEHLRLSIAGVEFHLFVNEDARSLGLAPNMVATGLYIATFDPASVRAATARDPEAWEGLTIRGNVWLWHGAAPAGW